MKRVFICMSYEKHYGKKLVLPRWNDIKQKYLITAVR